MGFAIVLYAVSALFSAMKAIADALAVLRAESTPRSRERAMTSYAEFCTLVDLDAYKRLDDEFGAE